MIKKKCSAYRQIKDHIDKLTIIQQATGFSPRRLVGIHLINNKDFREKRGIDQLASDSAYKYFEREKEIYLKENGLNQGYNTMLKFFEGNYLTKNYFGMDYFEVQGNYKNQEAVLKGFVRDAFIATFPITPEMSKSEVAVRNQKLGKISVSHWIGDIVNYDYFYHAPNFMIENVNRAIQIAEMFIFNLLNDASLDIELAKLSTNQRLQTKLQSKQTIKPKIVKI